MRHWLLHSLFVLGVSMVFAQSDQVEKTWKQEKDKIEYQKARKYKGPDDWYGDSPASIESFEPDETVIPADAVNPYSPNSPGGNQAYTQEEIQREREKRYGKNYSNKGNGQTDPELLKPDPIEFPEFDSPEVDGPDVDLPDVNAPDFLSSAQFWWFLLFLVVFALVIWAVYYFAKNKKPSDKQVVQSVDNEWNPTIVTKSALELKLETALSRGDFREGVRIYFMFILQELANQGKINWRSEKTNYDYLNEMRGKTEFDGFEKSVQIFDLVWYGDYIIDHEIYVRLQPVLQRYYQSIAKTT